MFNIKRKLGQVFEKYPGQLPIYFCDIFVPIYGSIKYHKRTGFRFVEEINIITGAIGKRFLSYCVVCVIKVTFNIKGDSGQTLNGNQYTC